MYEHDILDMAIDNMTNTTTESYGQDDYLLPDLFRWTLIVLYFLMAMVAIGGNSVVCFIVYRMNNLRTVTNFFIVSLAVTDITMTIICVPFTVLSNLVFYYWPFGNFMCPFVGYIQVMSVLLRAFTLVALTCDRYYVALKPLKTRLSKMKAKCAILVVWILAVIIALPIALNSKIIYLPKEPGSLGLCSEVWENGEFRNIYGVLLMLLQYFVPLTLMTVTYIHIGIIIWVKRPPGEADTQRDQRLAVSKRKTIKMIIAVVVAYALSWLPLHVLTLVGDADPSIYNNSYVHMLWLFTHWLAFSNSGTNPIIYHYMNNKFREGFMDVVHMIICRKPKRRSHMLFRDSMRLSGQKPSIRSGSGQRNYVPEKSLHTSLTDTSSPSHSTGTPDHL